MTIASTREEAIFRSPFLNVSAEEIAEGIAADGFYVAEGALLRTWIEKIESDLATRPLVLNTNDVGPVRWHHQTYFAHALAASRPYFELVTHRRVRAIARAYLGGQFRLKCQRYYQSASGHELSWHTDNKTSTGERTEVNGIGIVMYMCDTYEGELQVIRGSHKWPTLNTEFSDDDLNEEQREEVRTLSARAGTLIFFDSKTLHRTRKITLDGFVRRSIFAQIDSDLQHSERTLLDPSLIDPDDRELLRFLGVGMPAGYPVMPPSTLQSVTDRDLLSFARQALRELSRRYAPRPLLRVASALGRAVRRA